MEAITKLRNKKTGEVVLFSGIGITVRSGGKDRNCIYQNLAELTHERVRPELRYRRWIESAEQRQ